MKISKPFVSVIIPALNEEKYVGRCLESIFNLNYPGSNYEVIVVDNGSTDKTIDIAKKYGVKIFVKPKVSIAALRNFGAKQSRGDILAFIDSDCEAEKEWLNKAVKNLKKVDVTGNEPLAPKNGTVIQKAWEFHYNRNRKKEEYISSGSIIMKKETFDILNGFNESLRTDEDYDFCERLKLKGKSIYKDKSITVIHNKSPKNICCFFKKEVWHGKEMPKFMLKRKSIILSNTYMFAFIYLTILILIAVSIIIRNNYFLFTLLTILFLIPLILSLITNLRQKTVKFVFPLTLIYLMYGLARAICLINPKNYKK
jgi:glycosyltransferase involved in cell wall biosynthesis